MGVLVLVLFVYSFIVKVVVLVLSFLDEIYVCVKFYQYLALVVFIWKQLSEANMLSSGFSSQSNNLLLAFLMSSFLFFLLLKTFLLLQNKRKTIKYLMKAFLSVFLSVPNLVIKACFLPIFIVVDGTTFYYWNIKHIIPVYFKL